MRPSRVIRENRRQLVEYDAPMTAEAFDTPATAQPSAIQTRGVGYRYAGATHDALTDVNLDVPRGEIFGLLGPNGAGKSTLLSLLSTSLSLQSGEIAIGGESLLRRARQIRCISAVVPQEYAFYESLTGQQNLNFFGSVFGLSRADRARRCARAVEVCRLGEHLKKSAGQYSGGLKRRLNLAIGLLNEPQILYLDEPTVGIDAQSRHYIIDAVMALKSSGTTIVYTSHYMEEVEQLCDSVAVIDNGRVIVQERMENLLRREGAQSLQITLHEANPKAAPVLQPFAAMHVDFKVWTLDIGADRLPEVLLQLTQHGISFERVQYGVSRLEKIYLSLLLGASEKAEASA
jgi:ABC-2 type transport system ATP-binding protein